MAQKPRKIFGYHLALDLYDCDEAATRNFKACYYFLDTLPGKIGTNKQASPFVIYSEGLGFSGWVPIVESGFSLYISFPVNFVSFDIYSCKKFDKQRLEKLIIGFFKPKRVKRTFFVRGRDYIHPMKLLKIRGLG